MFALQQRKSIHFANPNIKSVEMTEYGSPYEGEIRR